MKKKGSFLAKNVGIFLLLTTFILLPVLHSTCYSAEVPPTGPATTETDQDRDRGGAGGDAGPGAARGLKRSTWLWIGGGVLALIGIIAAAGGGGGGGGGGSTSDHP